jgi:hypothetical protein
MFGIAGGIVLAACLCIGGCVVLVGLGAKGIADAEKQEREEKERKQRQGREEARRFPPVTSAALIEAYKDNEIAADLKYKDKWLRVRGPVRFSGKGSGSDINVTLGGGGAFEVWGVRCVFGPESAARVAELKQGQTVTAVGRCDGKHGSLLSEVRILECTFEDDEGTARPQAPAGEGPQGGRPAEPLKFDSDQKVRWEEAGNSGRVGDVSAGVLLARPWVVNRRDFGAWKLNEMLVVKLKLTNTSTTKIVTFGGWQGKATLVDEHGNEYRAIHFGAGLGGFGDMPGGAEDVGSDTDAILAYNLRLHPGKSYITYLFYEKPAAVSREARLTLPAEALGGTGTIRLQVPIANAEAERRAAEEAENRRRQQQAEEEAKRRAEEAKRREEAAKQQAERERAEREDAKARVIMRQALSLADRGFTKEARKRYQEIIDKYSDTPTAAKARKILEKLK